MIVPAWRGGQHTWNISGILAARPSLVPRVPNTLGRMAALLRAHSEMYSSEAEDPVTGNGQPVTDRLDTIGPMCSLVDDFSNRPCAE
jgi:hypothetical protein